MTSPLSSLHPPTTSYRRVGGTDAAWTFAGAGAEYAALRERAGVIDLSCSSLIEVRDGESGFLQRVLARDVEYLTSERCMTSLVLDEGGVPVDVVVVYGRDGGALLESSFGRGAELLAHLEALAGDDVVVTDVSDTLTTLGIEGPYAWGVIGRLLEGELAALPFESVMDARWQGSEVLFARTGVSAEYGYRVVASHEVARGLWKAAVALAEPVGLEVLETAMIEVRQPLCYRESTGDAGVIALGLNWLVDSTKDDFVGRDAVLEEFRSGVARRTIGFGGPGAPPPAGSRLVRGDVEVGTVVHAVSSLGRGETLGLARVDEEFAVAGVPLDVRGPDGCTSAVNTLTSPYVYPRSWSIPII